jgi:hypothetical protein
MAATVVPLRGLTAPDHLAELGLGLPFCATSYIALQLDGSHAGSLRRPAAQKMPRLGRRVLPSQACGGGARRCGYGIPPGRGYLRVGF